MNIKTKKGFSLLELILVLGVGTMVSFMKFQDMRNNQENILASTVGQQMKQIGEAVNGYINIKYDKLSTLSNAAGNKELSLLILSSVIFIDCSSVISEVIFFIKSIRHEVTGNQCPKLVSILRYEVIAINQ